MTLYHNHTNIPIGRPGGPSDSVDGILTQGKLTRSALTGSLQGHSIAALKGLAYAGQLVAKLEGQFPVVADAANTLLTAAGVVEPLVTKSCI